MFKELLEQNGQRVLITHFGDLIKYVCSTFFGWNGKKDSAGRSMLQEIGMVVREREPDFWIDFLKKVLNIFSSEWDYVLIPDCRFPREVDGMTDSGFKTYLIKVVRPECETDLTEEQRKHPSETAMDDYPADYYVVNDSSLLSMKNKVSKIAKLL